MNGLITGVEQAFTAKGAEYKKVTVLDDKGKTTIKNVFDNLSEKWPLLEENKYREFKMEKSGQFWNVKDILEIEIPESQPSDKLLPKDQAIIDEEVRVKPAPQDNRSKEIEFNMWWKIAAEMVGNSDLMTYIETNFKSGKTFRKATTLAVITQALVILPIKVEDK